MNEMGEEGGVVIMAVIGSVWGGCRRGPTWEAQPRQRGGLVVVVGQEAAGGTNLVQLWFVFCQVRTVSGHKM